MLQTLVVESHQLVRLVENLLDMARLESGTMALNRQWHVLEELVGSAIARLRRQLDDHVVKVQIPADFPLIFVDGVLSGASVRQSIGKRLPLYSARGQD